MKAAHFGEREIMNRLVDQGAPLSGALSGVEHAKLGCHLRLTAVAAVCLEFRDDTSYQELLYKLLCWGADSHTAAVCETHGGDHSKLTIGCALRTKVICKSALAQIITSVTLSNRRST